MENVREHSKVKLGIAVFTSPGAAFEEINRRGLLGTGLVIIALTGLVAAVPAVIAAATGDDARWLSIGRANPITWLGLCMLYAFAMQKLLKWVGSKVEYVPLLTLMGWSQLSLLIAQIATIGLTYGQISGSQNGALVSAAIAASLLFSLWYAYLMGPAVNVLCGSPVARGILTYIVIEVAAMIGFSSTYGSARMSNYEHALTGIRSTAAAVAGADQLPWTAAAVVGLVVGMLQIAKHFEWDDRTAKTRAAVAGLVGLAVFTGYAYAMSSADYYGRLSRAQYAYSSGEYDKAAAQMTRLLPLSREKLALTLDIADAYYLAKNDEKALKSFDAAVRTLKGVTGTEKDGALARISDGRGMVYDSRGDYDKAIAEFQQATKLWKEFREPWVRLAVTYDRLGNYDKAIASANHAVKELDSEAVVAWVALAQAWTATGDTKQAKVAVAMVKSKDEDLAKRIGSGLDAWKDAVGKLTREDLKFPLEKELAPAPKQKSQAQSQKSKSKDQEPKAQGKPR